MAEERRFAQVEQRANIYCSIVESDVDPIIESSNISDICFEFADIVIQGCALYDSVRELDDDWSRLVQKREVEFCPAYEERLNQLYVKWIVTSRRAMHIYSRLESEYADRGFDTERVLVLGRFCRDAQRILRNRSPRYEALVQINSELESRQMPKADAAELRIAMTSTFVPLGPDEASPLPTRGHRPV